MTSEQYQRVAESFWEYADALVEYETSYIGRDGKHTTTSGYLKGVGVGCNKETLIIAYLGYTNAIHYSRVKFPRK